MSSSVPLIVFVGSYAAENEAGIHAFSFHESSGGLSPLGSFAGIPNPSFLTVHPNGRWMYAVSENSQAVDGVPGGVCALSFERDPFALALLDRRSSGGDWPCHLSLDTSGRWLLTTNYGSGSIAVFPIQDDGRLGEMSDRVQHSGSGPNAQRQEGPHTHSVTLSADNQFALVADLGLDQIVLYKFDAQAGKLSRHGEARTRPGAGPRHIALHPNGEWLYLANELDNTVSVYSFDQKDGTLISKQTLSSLPPGAPENTQADIHVSISGRRVYSSNRGHNSVAVYDIGGDGSLTLASIQSCGGDWPRNFALTPDGKFMLVANERSDEVDVLPLVEGTQGVGRAVPGAKVQRASCIKVI